MGRRCTLAEIEGAVDEKIVTAEEGEEMMEKMRKVAKKEVKVESY